MAGALVFLVGQLFLFGTTSAQCPFPCSDCKEFAGGTYAGTWSLKEAITSRCLKSCLYQHSDGTEMCFCDPGQTEYGDTCCELSVQITNALSVFVKGKVTFDDNCSKKEVEYGPSAPGSTTTVTFPECTCKIVAVIAETIEDPSIQCSWTSGPTQTGPFTIRLSSPGVCEVTKP